MFVRGCLLAAVAAPALAFSPMAGAPALRSPAAAMSPAARVRPALGLRMSEDEEPKVSCFLAWSSARSSGRLRRGGYHAAAVSTFLPRFVYTPGGGGVLSYFELAREAKAAGLSWLR